MKFIILKGKFFSEALILGSTNPQFDKRLFIELIYQFSTWKLQAQNMGRTCCVHKLFWMSKQKQKTICVHNMFSPCSELVVFMYWTGKSMNNLLSYCARTAAEMDGTLHTDFQNLKPVEISKKSLNIIWTSLKVV